MKFRVRNPRIVPAAPAKSAATLKRSQVYPLGKPPRVVAEPVANMPRLVAAICEDAGLVEKAKVVVRKGWNVGQTSVAEDIREAFAGDAPEENSP